MTTQATNPERLYVENALRSALVEAEELEQTLMAGAYRVNELSADLGQLREMRKNESNLVDYIVAELRMEQEVLRSADIAAAKSKPTSATKPKSSIRRSAAQPLEVINPNEAQQMLEERGINPVPDSPDELESADTPPNAPIPRSVLTAGDAGTRDKQFEHFLQTIARTNPSHEYTMALRRLAEMESKEGYTQDQIKAAERLLSAQRAVADIKIARINALSRLLPTTA